MTTTAWTVEVEYKSGRRLSAGRYKSWHKVEARIARVKEVQDLVPTVNSIVIIRVLEHVIETKVLREEKLDG